MSHLDAVDAHKNVLAQLENDDMRISNFCSLKTIWYTPILWTKLTSPLLAMSSNVCPQLIRLRDPKLQCYNVINTRPKVLHVWKYLDQWSNCQFLLNLQVKETYQGYLQYLAMSSKMRMLLFLGTVANHQRDTTVCL